MPKLKYKTGNLLKELSYNSSLDVYELMGLYIIVGLDQFDAHVVSIYDRDGYYKPLSRIDISHDDLYKNRKMFKWEIKK